MTGRLRGITLGAAAALAAALACGDVPTLPKGIAYITPIIAASPALANNDTLRDSLGVATPLHVYAVASNGDTISDVAVRYLFTTLGTRASIDEHGFLISPDSLETLHIVAQVTDPAGGSGLQLQTPELVISVVPLADSLFQTTTDTTSATLPTVRALPITVTGVGPKQTRGVVAGTIVHYAISQIFPASANVPSAPRYFLLNKSNSSLRPDSTVAVDTTSASGTATASLVGVLAPDGGTNADSIIVTATARSQKGVLLRPVRFVIKIKQG